MSVVVDQITTTKGGWVGKAALGGRLRGEGGKVVSRRSILLTPPPSKQEIAPDSEIKYSPWVGWLHT